MKSTILILFCSMFLFATQANAETQAKKHSKTTVFNVNVHCVSCQQKIEKNISYEKGVKDLVVNMEAKTVSVSYDSRKNSDEQLIAAFDKLGYVAVAEVASCCGKSKNCHGETKKECTQKDGKKCCGKAKADCKSKESKPCAKSEGKCEPEDGKKKCCSDHK